MADSRYKNKVKIERGNEILTFPEFNNKKNDQSILWRNDMQLSALAYRYYNDAKYWWVIAMYNNIDLEKNIKIGQTIYIPELTKVLNKV